MTDNTDEALGFAPPHDQAVPYLARIREYYAGLGYGAPYRWAQYADVPFTPVTKPVSDMCIGLITTAAPYQPDKGDQGPGAPYNAAAKFFTVYSGDTAHDHDVRISHISYDRQHTSAADSNSWFPLPALRRAAARGYFARLARRFHGAPTNRSHLTTLDIDCVELLARCRADEVDAVLLVAT
jgi:hypothetical protein